MTVMCLSETQKQIVADLYSTRFYPIQQLALDCRVSTTTIRNVLIEKGAIKLKPVLSVDEGKMLLLLKKHNITPKKLSKLLENN